MLEDSDVVATVEDNTTLEKSCGVTVENNTMLEDADVVVTQWRIIRC
jgi:hypothetical protein